MQDIKPLHKIRNARTIRKKGLGNNATPDYTVPDFPILKEIHDKIDDAKNGNDKIYVHCKGGHDRTGAVVATYFVHIGLSPSEAKKKFREVFIPPVRGRYPHSPLIETDWKVLDRYKEWLENTNNGKKKK
jgi:protein-tyrosine phosphatase